MANWRRTRGGILGCTASSNLSNSARVITVLQFESSGFPAAGFGQTPLIVTTGASGGTLEASALPAGVAVPLGAAPGCWVAGVGAGLAAWPQAMAASSKQTNPYSFIFDCSSTKIEKGQGKS